MRTLLPIAVAVLLLAVYSADACGDLEIGCWPPGHCKKGKKKGGGSGSGEGGDDEDDPAGCKLPGKIGKMFGFKNEVVKATFAGTINIKVECGGAPEDIDVDVECVTSGSTYAWEVKVGTTTVTSPDEVWAAVPTFESLLDDCVSGSDPITVTITPTDGSVPAEDTTEITADNTCTAGTAPGSFVVDSPSNLVPLKTKIQTKWLTTSADIVGTTTG